MSDKSRVFISHSHDDGEFVRRLVGDLSGSGLDVWLDERELKVGDSLIDGISAGLSDTDYLVVVLSEASVESKWVRQELNAALVAELTDGGTVVLPVRLDDCEVPALLRDRVYADFRTDYQTGLAALTEVFRQETSPPPGSGPLRAAPTKPHDVCRETLALLSDADVRRLLHRRLDRVELRALWHAVLGGDLNDEMEGRDKLSCALDLVIRARRKSLMLLLYRELCADHPGIGPDASGP